MLFPPSPVPPQLSEDVAESMSSAAGNSRRVGEQPTPTTLGLNEGLTPSPSQPPSPPSLSSFKPTWQGVMMGVGSRKTRLVHTVDLNSLRMRSGSPLTSELDKADVKAPTSRSSCSSKPAGVDDDDDYAKLAKNSLQDVVSKSQRHHQPELMAAARDDGDDLQLNKLNTPISSDVDSLIAQVRSLAVEQEQNASTAALQQQSKVPQSCPDGHTHSIRLGAATKYVPTSVRFQDLLTSSLCTNATLPTASMDDQPDVEDTKTVAVVKKAAASSKQPCGPPLVFRSNSMSSPNDPKVARSPIVLGAATSLPCLSTVKVNGQNYSVLKLIGQGGSSKVFEVYSGKLFAIKCVDLRGADKAVRDGYLNEVNMLQRLQHSSRVVRFHDHEYNREERRLYVVMERGDVDMATFIETELKEGGCIAPDIVNCYWAEMLRAVRDIHREGIIHSDLKPANFLLVAGKLKIIDFGIASAIPKDMTSVIKDVKCGTANYISPEALMEVDGSVADGEQIKIKIGVKSDVWSLGCILYHMVYGRTPFQHIVNSGMRLLAIIDPSVPIVFPPLNCELLLDVLKRCIVRDVKHRASIDELLNHPYIPRGYTTQKPAK